MFILVKPDKEGNRLLKALNVPISFKAGNVFVYDENNYTTICLNDLSIPISTVKLPISDLKNAKSVIMASSLDKFTKFLNMEQENLTNKLTEMERNLNNFLITMNSVSSSIQTLTQRLYLGSHFTKAQLKTFKYDNKDKKIKLTGRDSFLVDLGYTYPIYEVECFDGLIIILTEYDRKDI